MRMKLAATLVVAAATLTMADPARADQPSPSSSSSAQPAPITAKQRADAKRLFNQAHLAYQNGDYEEAILKWQASFELSKEPLIYESIANAYDRLHDSRHTLEFLEKWRPFAPRQEQKALDNRIERVKEQVAIDDAEQKKRDEEEKRRKEEEEKRRAGQVSSEPQSGPRSMKILGWTLTGMGAGLVVAGVILDIVAGTGRPDKNTACASSTSGELLCLDEQRSAIQTTNAMAIAGDVSWIVGGAATVAGVVVLLTVARKPVGGGDKAGAATVVPWVAPGTGGASLRVTF
jgi:tetratricopeptide (TPR) repeat protein